MFKTGVFLFPVLFLAFFFFFSDMADKVENEQAAGWSGEVTEWGADTPYRKACKNVGGRSHVGRRWRGETLIGYRFPLRPLAHYVGSYGDDILIVLCRAPLTAGRSEDILIFSLR